VQQAVLRESDDLAGKVRMTGNDEEVAALD
jgi:hypothetical protein